MDMDCQLNDKERINMSHGAVREIKAMAVSTARHYTGISLCDQCVVSCTIASTVG